MRLKAQEVYDMYSAIDALTSETTTMPAAYYIAKNTKIIKEEAAALDEARQKLIAKYGEKKEDGNLNIQEDGRIKIANTDLNNFNEEMSKLFQVDLDLPIKKIPLSALEKLNVSIRTMEALLPLIEDDTVYSEAKETAPEKEGVDLTLDENGNITNIN